MKPSTMLAKLELVCAQKDTKCSFPLGPYPRYTWIHEDTPEDGLDKACYQIWKRVQQLSAQLERSPREADGVERSQAKVGFEGEEEAGDPVWSKVEGKAADSCGRDDVSLLVQLEYLSILGENISMDLHQSGLEGNGLLEQGLKKQEEIQCPVSEAGEKDNLLDSFLKPCGGTQLNENSLAEDKAGGTKSDKRNLKDALLSERSTEVSVASNTEICQLLAQFSLKHINEREAPDNSVVMEEAQIIKHFLQNNMFSSAGDRKAEVVSPLPLSARGTQSRRQLPVFAKLCEELPPLSRLQGHLPLHAAASTDCREELPSAPAPDGQLPEAARPGTDLLRLLCMGQKEASLSTPGGQDSPKAASLELKSSRSEHSYSSTRHSLKGLAAATRRTSQDSKELAKPWDAPNRQLGPKSKEELPSNKGGSGARETTLKRAAHTLSDAEDKVPGSRRENAVQKPNAQDGDSLGAHSSSDSAGSGNKEEGHAGGSGPARVSGRKDSEGRYGGKAFPSPAESNPSGVDSPVLGHPDKSTAGSGLQRVGAACDTGSKHGPLAFPARYTGGPVTIPNRSAFLNYPLVPATATSTLGYAQQQPFYQTRSLRLSQQQPSCPLRPNNAYSQLAHDFLPRQTYIRAAYPPLVGYWSFVPEYSYPTRNNPKPVAPIGGGNNAPPMAGDGPQCLFQPAYGYLDSNVSTTRFSAGRTGPLCNNGTFQLYYPADGSGYRYW